MLNETRVGPVVAADGAVNPARSGKDGSTVVSQSRGKYYEAASRGKLFTAANQADTTWSVALHTTHTGLVVSNPRNSGVNLAIVRASFGLVLAPAGEASMTFFGGYDADAEVTHTTPLVITNNIIGGAHGVANADGAATLPTAPVNLETFMGGFADATLPSTGPAIIDLDGAFIVPPGAYFGISALTVVHGMGSITWEEIAI